MKKHIFSRFIGLVSVVLLACGCYREEIAELHNQIDAIEFREVTEQLNQMKASVEGLESLKTTLEHQVEALTKEKDELQKQIDSLKALLETADGDTEKIKSDLSKLEDKFKDVEGAIGSISTIENTIKTLQGQVETLTGKDLDNRLVALENAQVSFATIDSLNALKDRFNNLKETVDAFDKGIVDVIVDAIKNNQDQIAGIISESPVIVAMFKDYCKTSDLNAAIKGLKDNEIADLEGQISEIRSSITNAITEAINGLAIDEKFQTVNNRLEALERAIAQIGDLTQLKTTAQNDLVSAINELAGLVEKTAGDFEAYYDTTEVKNLLSALESTLAIAIADGDKVNADSIKALAQKVKDITTAETGLIDQRIKAAIDALGDIVTSEDLAAFATQKELDSIKTVIGTSDNKGSLIARITALEAINVTIESKNYTSWADAVKAVYDSLTSKIGNVSAISGDLTKLSVRVDSINTIIGGGFTSTNTIAKAISDLESLFGDLGDKNTVASLIANLQSIQNSLSGAMYRDSVNLVTLKATVDAILKDSGVQSFKAAMDSLNKSISNIKAIIGGSYSSTSTVAAAIDALDGRLDVLEGLGYGDDINAIKGVIDSVRTVLTSKIDASTFASAKNRIDSLVNALNSLSINSKTGLNNILSDLNQRISDLKDTTGVHRSEIDAIKSQIAEISKNLDSNILWNLLSGNISTRFTELIENYTKFREILDRLNKIDVQFVYIPDYLYGDQVTVSYHNGSVVGGATLAFNVYSTQEISSSVFTTNSIRGLFVQTQKIGDTKATAPSNAVKPSIVSYDNGVLLVTFAQSDIQKYYTGGSIAIIYGDFSSGNYSPWYSTSYFPMHFVDTGNIGMNNLSGDGATYDSTKSVLNISKKSTDKEYKILLTGCTSATGLTVNYQSLASGNFSFSKSSFKLTTESNKVYLVFTVPANKSGCSGKISITMADGSAFTFMIKLNN